MWKKWQKIQRDWSIAWEESNEPEVTTDEKLTMAVEEMQAPEEESQPVQTITKTPTEVAKWVTKIIKQQNDNVEMVIEEAKDTPAPATESIAETVVKKLQKATQESLFWWPSLDSIKNSVEDRINKIIKISLNEDDINDRIEDIEKDIEDLEKEDNPDQEDIDSLNSEKNELVDQLETLSTFKKIVDESEDFDTIKQYLSSELDRLKEWDTNTIMGMASQYWILEWVSNTSEVSVKEQVEEPQQVQAPTLITKIISWWQSWADKAWLQIAKALWIPTWWTAPKWYRTEKWTDNTLIK